MKVYLLFAGAVVLNVLFFASFPLPPSYFADLPFPRPYEFVAASVFAAALWGYWKKREWRNDFFKAQPGTFVPFTVEIQGDWAAMESEMRRMMMVAKDDLEMTAFATGSGCTRDER